MITRPWTTTPSPRTRKFFRWHYVPQETRQAYILACLLSWSVLSFILISHFVLGSVQIDGTSMEATLHDGECHLVNRWIFYFRAPRRGELVVIRDNVDDNLCVKRIVGLPEEQLQIKQGRVYINGRPLPESYLTQGLETWPLQYGARPLTLGKDRFFVLGDNRENSLDSRSYGALDRKNVLGLVNP